MPDDRLRVTITLQARCAPMHLQAAAAAAALGAVARVRVVPARELLGRDLRECDRLVCAGWRCVAEALHLRELFAQGRDRTVMLVADGAAAAGDDAALAVLRRNCGRVAVGDRNGDAALRPRLLVPVHPLPTDAPMALWSLLVLAPGPGDSVETHMVEANQWIARGDLRGAFGAAARALQLAPDQPGIVADVARLLARLGEGERAVALCRSFLRQRPDAGPVLAAVTELARELPRVPPPAAATAAASVPACPAAAGADPRTAPPRSL